VHTTANHKLVILGAGPAGLAIGHYAKKAGLDFTIYEAQNHVGGNCSTLQHGNFRFDSGAHRFHDKDPEATREIKRLLGDDLRQIDVPSQIWHRGRLFDFPIAPFNLLKTLGPWGFTRALFSLIRGRLPGRVPRRSVAGSFEDFALRTYGADIASRFLLNYSEKLWGAPCDQLSPAICGARLKGLNLASLLIEALLGRRANTRHLDGAFYYPRQGYGAIVERLADACGHDRLRLHARVTRLLHDGERIRSVEINDRERVPVEEIASTLPIGMTLKLLTPGPPGDILERSAGLRYRNVVLVAVFLAKNRVTKNGSVYFPDPSVPFTRVYEPKNRSDEMSPPGRTSLVAEFPCQPGDSVWTAGEDVLLDVVREHFERVGWITRGDVIGGTTHRLHHAYPILELGYESRLAPVGEYLSQFRNLRLAGRNGCFVYSHLHDMLRYGREVVDGYKQQPSVGWHSRDSKAMGPGRSRAA
jgi:protoporphyrinogen oxidase